jgi:hypothetical protein
MPLWAFARTRLVQGLQSLTIAKLAAPDTVLVIASQVEESLNIMSDEQKNWKSTRR